MSCVSASFITEVYLLLGFYGETSKANVNVANKPIFATQPTIYMGLINIFRNFSRQEISLRHKYRGPLKYVDSLETVSDTVCLERNTKISRHFQTMKLPTTDLIMKTDPPIIRCMCQHVCAMPGDVLLMARRTGAQKCILFLL
jgi:hypothetical protein